jgi:photosystem II stability/assembly factor-like uncharacterized protein
MKQALRLVLFTLAQMSLCGSGLVFSQTNFWEQTNGPFVEQVQSLASNSKGKVFAAAGYSFYLSTDAGRSWSKTGMDYVMVSSVAVNADGDIFLGTLGLVEGRIYRSTNDGQTWQLLNLGFGIASVRSLVVSNTGWLFAGCDNGIVRSINNGDDWSLANVGLPQAAVLCLLVSSKDTVFAGTTAGLFRSVNGGDEWQAVGSREMQTDIYSLTANLDHNLFAGTNRGRVFRSSDAGETWFSVNSGLPDADINSLYAQTPELLFAATDSGAYSSIDEGDNWNQLTSIPKTTRVNAFVSLSSNDHLMATSEGVYISTDGGTEWKIRNIGLLDSRVWSLLIDSTRRIYAGTEGGGIYYTDDRGDRWVQSGLAGTRPYSIALSPEGHLFVGIDGGVYRSTDRGQTWIRLNNGFEHFPTVTSIVVHRSGVIFCSLSGTDGGIYRSTDHGEKWSRVTEGLTTQNTLSLAIDQSDVLYAGTFGGGLFRSTDVGDHWTQRSIGLMDTVVRTIAVDPCGDVYAGTYDGVFRSTNQGMNWSFVGLSTTTVWSIAIHSSGGILAGSATGIYHSEDRGASWNQLVGGLTDLDVRSIAIDPQGYALAGTLSSGVFRSTGTLTEVEPLSSQVQGWYALHQNYPNPFNPSTAISYDLAARSHVTLRIFNVLGQEVATLVNEIQEAGFRSVRFDGSGLPSGVYFCRFRASNFVQTQKLVLVR